MYYNSTCGNALEGGTGYCPFRKGKLGSLAQASLKTVRGYFGKGGDREENYRKMNSARLIKCSGENF